MTREQLLERYWKLKVERDQIVNDAEHWNRTHPNEEPIDPGAEEMDRVLDGVREKLGGKVCA